MRRRTTPKFWIFMIVSMLVVFGACFGVLLNQYLDGAQRLEQVQSARDELISQVDALSHEMDYVQTDEYIMRAARDELGLIMPGEIRYVNAG
ncbi:MAG: hypothetical protein E7337_05775 [Clostridiales bacterium]|nr:hypothetical protein [Clostridiales bacterium]